MDEPRRDKQVGLRFTAVEHAELEQASGFSNMVLAQWCRQELLRAARGERAERSIEVPRGDLEALQESLKRQGKLLLLLLSELASHTHHGDPRSEHEDPNVRALGKKRASRKMEQWMAELGLDGAER